MAHRFFVCFQAGQLAQAVSICIKNLHDYQLALLIVCVHRDVSARTPVLRDLWLSRIIPIAKGAGDYWLQSIAYWQLEQLRNAALVLFSFANRKGMRPLAIAEPLKAKHHPYPRLTKVSDDRFDVAQSYFCDAGAAQEFQLGLTSAFLCVC